MEVTSCFETAASPDDVFACLANAESDPGRQSGMVSACWTTDGPIGVGSTYEHPATS